MRIRIIAGDEDRRFHVLHRDVLVIQILHQPALPAIEGLAATLMGMFRPTPAADPIIEAASELEAEPAPEPEVVAEKEG